VSRVKGLKSFFNKFSISLHALLLVLFEVSLSVGDLALYADTLGKSWKQRNFQSFSAWGKRIVSWWQNSVRGLPI
jgi:hypothetical protein